MRVVGIDPGPVETALCVWDGKQILAAWKEPHDRALTLIANYKALHIDIAAVEILQCFGMGVGKEVFETAYNIGELRAECRHTGGGVEYVPVTRIQVKIYHCHSARATDSNIRFALEDRFGPKGTKKNQGVMYPLVGSDMRSAFAIAVMIHDQRNNKAA